VSNKSDALIKALREMPVPEPRPGFVDRVLAGSTRGERLPSAERGAWKHVATRWETWFGAAVGGAVAAALTLFLFRPIAHQATDEGITLALHEARDIDVLIESDRELRDATIRVAVTGGVALDGLDNERIVDWRTDLDRGANLLSLPVIARQPGTAQLVAVIEHGGKTRTTMINLTVSRSETRS
jgi:hypothetical protein